jgi:hypothetical protein
VVRLGPALDQIRCTLSVTSPIPHVGTARYEAFVTVDLHKKTDPRPEFEDQHAIDAADLTPAETATTVSGLGDLAYVLTVSEQRQQLKVLHGGAVFTLTVTGYNTLTVSDDTLNALHGRSLSTPDLREFQPALIGAMRNVMTRQRQQT